ncbi:hypothetical protein HCA89_00300 [Listeria innocua]|uniref:Uncharacterized protein n=1 Tax=Listeria innocua TaxID=1642 RepID=A0AB73H3T3_LISIO|nr:hypothetical protein [Listeria innocua]MBC2140732.1 hypothetical protein [Listeria innocua]
MVEIRFAARPNLSIDKEEMFDLMMKQCDDELLNIELACRGIPSKKANIFTYEQQLILMHYRYKKEYEYWKEFRKGES